MSDHLIAIDHTRSEDHSYHQKLLNGKTLNDSSTDIRFIVDSVEIPAHNQVIDILKDKRQLVRDAIERDRKIAQSENTEAANVFQMSGTTVNAFSRLLDYVYTGKVDCDLNTGIELAITAHKLKFHPLVASLAQQLAEYMNDCMNLNTIDDLYHIAKSADNKQLLKSCRKFLDDKGYDLNSLFLKRDTQLKDPPNVLIYALDKNRYNNYIHFLLPKDIEICFNVSVSSDRINWTVVLRNEEIWSKFWNWVYFEERRIKFIKIEGTEQKDGKHFDAKQIRDDHFLCKRANIEFNFDALTGHLIPNHDIIKFPIPDTKFYFDEKYNNFTYCMSTMSTKDLVKQKEKFYYYHNIGDENSLEFYLPQTCLIDKFQFRLWDNDQRSYDFKVEVKNEEEKWSLIKEDKNSDYFRNKKSWVVINLKSRRSVRWIRITGNKGPAYDKEFAIIDFECPALTSHSNKN